MIVSQYSLIVSDFLVNFKFILVSDVDFSISDGLLKARELLFILGIFEAELLNFGGESFYFLTQKCSFVLHICIPLFELLVLSVKIVKSHFIVANLPAGIHLVFLNNGDLLVSDLSSQVLNVNVSLLELLVQSISLLGDDCVLVFVLVEFFLQQLQFP